MARSRNSAASRFLSTLTVYLDSLDSRTKSRGRSYFREGRVLDVNADGSEALFGIVQGSEDYEVELSFSGSSWHSLCSCPLGSDCKHVFAAGFAWLNRQEQEWKSGAESAEPPAVAAATPAPALRIERHEQPLVDSFTKAAGHAPDRRQLAWLRNLTMLQDSLRPSSYRWFNVDALRNLAPPEVRSRVPYDQDPFAGWWHRPPPNPLALWPFVALYFTERHIPLVEFAAPFAAIEKARMARDGARREAELKAWRDRFAELDRLAATPLRLDQPRQTLRLRVGPKKWPWEISAQGADGPFAALPASQLQEMIHNAAHSAVALDDAGNAFLAFVRANQLHRGRTSLAATSEEDCTLLGHFLDHPATRARIVNAEGRPLVAEPRPLTWQWKDHPSDPGLVTVQLGFADGSPAPSPLVHIPGHPAHTRYLSTDGRIFAGPPPVREPLKPVGTDGFATTLPRAALALPEAGRFAARSGLVLPGDTSDRFRTESLRARIRLSLDSRNAAYSNSDELLVAELHALAAGDELRAQWLHDAWSTETDDVVRPPDAAFVLHDFAPLQPAVDHLLCLPGLRFHPYGTHAGRLLSEISSPGFPEQLALWLTNMPAGIVVELDPDLAALHRPPTRAQFDLEIEESGVDWFDVRVALKVEDTTLTPAEIELLRQAKGRFVRLPGRGWRRLEIVTDNAVIARLGLEAETVAVNHSGEAQKFHALQLADESLGDALPEKLARQIRDRVAHLRASPAPAVPPGLQAALRPYQVEGFHFLAHLASNRFGGVLADDMGLGKTLQTLAWLLWLSDEKKPAPRPKVRNANKGDAVLAPAGSVFRALVVCPKSVVFNWETETARFAPTLTTGRLAPRADQPVPAGVNLLIVNYAQLRLHAAPLADVTWDAVILDEGQNIKNPASATAAAARNLRTTNRIVLTGTPVENRLLDLWSLFAFAQPGLLGGQTAFKRLYNDRENAGAAHARLAARVRHFLLRRTKSQVARDLPARSEEEIVVELEGPQRALYDAELKRARQLLLGVQDDRALSSQRFNILQSLLRLRQICCDPRLLGAHLDAPRARRTATKANPGATVSAKLEALLDTLEPLLAEGHRVLVFSQFVSMLGLIREELVARDIGHLLLTGETENRQELVTQFQSAGGPPVFLLSLKAAGAGLNLTAASYVVLYDPWWNPAVEAQAIDRTHRIGQTSRVIAYRLLARDTVEEKIRALQKEKAALAAAVVQEESLAKVLDLESLRRILS